MITATDIKNIMPESGENINDTIQRVVELYKKAETRDETDMVAIFQQLVTVPKNSQAGPVRRAIEAIAKSRGIELWS